MLVVTLKKEIKNTDKVMVSGRIPLYVKEYCEKKKLKINDLMMKGFDSFRETDIDHALSRLDYHEKRVLHWKHIVLQYEQECNTKVKICNTVREQFVKQGRGHKSTYREDIFWCSAKSEHLINEGVMISGKELYKYCITEDNR